VAVIPILFAASPLGVAPAVIVVGAYEGATLFAMVALVLLSREGAAALRARWIDRYGDGAAGGLIAATGLVLMALGV